MMVVGVMTRAIGYCYEYSHRQRDVILLSPEINKFHKTITIPFHSFAVEVT